MFVYVLTSEPEEGSQMIEGIYASEEAALDAQVELRAEQARARERIRAQDEAIRLALDQAREERDTQWLPGSVYEDTIERVKNEIPCDVRERKLASAILSIQRHPILYGPAVSFLGPWNS